MLVNPRTVYVRQGFLHGRLIVLFTLDGTDYVWYVIIIIIIIIIIKKGRQCKAEREWYTPYQSEDPSPTIQTYRQKEEKGKESRRL